MARGPLGTSAVTTGPGALQAQGLPQQPTHPPIPAARGEAGPGAGQREAAAQPGPCAQHGSCSGLCGLGGRPAGCEGRARAPTQLLAGLLRDSRPPSGWSPRAAPWPSLGLQPVQRGSGDPPGRWSVHKIGRTQLDLNQLLRKDHPHGKNMQGCEGVRAVGCQRLCSFYPTLAHLQVGNEG